MTTLREAAQQALEALDWHSRHGANWASIDEATETLRAALAEPREHVTDGTQCWCNPETTYVDPDTGASVIVHKEPQ